MKKQLIVFICILIYGCNSADINDRDKRNENWVYWIDAKTGKTSWIPNVNESTVKNGEYTSFYANGAIYEKGKLKNGKNVDTIYSFDKNENLIKYKLVKPDTLLQYYIKDGAYNGYFQDGKIFEKGIVKSHEPGNEWIRYYKNGNIEWIEKYNNDIGLTLWYYDNGQILDSTFFIHGKAEGKVKKWYKNGQVDEISYWRNGLRNGSFITYYNNGNIKAKGNYKDGKLDGTIYWYNEDGKLKVKQKFVDGIFQTDVE